LFPNIRNSYFWWDTAENTPEPPPASWHVSQSAFAYVIYPENIIIIIFLYYNAPVGKGTRVKFKFKSLFEKIAFFSY
jgi:hypothetical protein